MAPVNDELSEIEKELFEKITNNDASDVKTLLMQHKFDPDVCDESGMTALQHAAYKGNKEIVQMMLDQGADVNCGKHEHGYTALHFAALSGNPEVCQLLLNAGVKTHTTNSVGRTAAQMAAFVGNHACVAVINNHVPKADIDYYTVPQGLETEPKLPPALAAPLHKFVMQVNIHPVRVALNLQKSPALGEHLDKIQKVLELMRDREMKRGFETNEVMAFKFHYLAFVIGEIARCKKRQQDRKKEVEGDKSTGSEEKRCDPTELFARKMLKSERTEFQESFLRECVREFPYRECTVFRQMVSSLAQEDPPTALCVVTAAINGQRGFVDSTPTCHTCGEEKPAKKCSKCKAVQYCDRECQRLDWFLHKKACPRLAQTANTTTSLSAEMKNLQVQA